MIGRQDKTCPCRRHGQDSKGENLTSSVVRLGQIVYFLKSRTTTKAKGFRVMAKSRWRQYDLQVANYRYPRVTCRDFILYFRETGAVCPLCTGAVCQGVRKITWGLAPEMWVWDGIVRENWCARMEERELPYYYSENS
jgi:hypothetical protein